MSQTTRPFTADHGSGGNDPRTKGKHAETSEAGLETKIRALGKMILIDANMIDPGVVTFDLTGPLYFPGTETRPRMRLTFDDGRPRIEERDESGSWHRVGQDTRETDTADRKGPLLGAAPSIRIAPPVQAVARHTLDANSHRIMPVIAEDETVLKFARPDETSDTLVQMVKARAREYVVIDNDREFLEAALNAAFTARITVSENGAIAAEWTVNTDPFGAFGLSGDGLTGHTLSIALGAVLGHGAGAPR